MMSKLDKGRGLAICALVTITLAGCGSDKAPDVVATGSAAEQAAKATGEAFKPAPGHWDVTMVMKDFEMGGMPPEAKAAMAAQLGQVSEIDACLTQEMADRNDGKFFVPNNKDCTIQKFAMIDGQLSSEMTCSENGGKQTVEMSGSYTAQSYDITTKSQGEIGGQPMKMVMHVTGKRNGECTGNEFDPEKLKRLSE